MALQGLGISTNLARESFSHCGLLHQLTALEIGVVDGRTSADEVDDCLWGLTQLRCLQLSFQQEGATALLLCVAQNGVISLRAARKAGCPELLSIHCVHHCRASRG
jgi:hypothetical protein